MAAAGDKETRSGRNRRKLDPKTVRTAVAGLLVILAVVLGIVALVGDDSDGDSGSGAEGSAAGPPGAKALSQSELLPAVEKLGRPVYWVGPRAGTERYELSSTPDGRVYIRYLTGDAKAGDPRAEFLTVGTYPVDEAKQALETATASDGQQLSEHDGYQVLGSAEATNAYVVYDDEPGVQIELYSPVPGEATDLANAGELEPLR